MVILVVLEYREVNFSSALQAYMALHACARGSCFLSSVVVREQRILYPAQQDFASVGNHVYLGTYDW